MGQGRGELRPATLTAEALCLLLRPGGALGVRGAAQTLQGLSSSPVTALGRIENQLLPLAWVTRPEVPIL